MCRFQIIIATDIFFLNETKGFAVMEWDQIFSTSDGGATWELLARIEKTVTDGCFYLRNHGVHQCKQWHKLFHGDLNFKNRGWRSNLEKDILGVDLLWIS